MWKFSEEINERFWTETKKFLPLVLYLQAMATEALVSFNAKNLVSNKKYMDTGLSKEEELALESFIKMTREMENAQVDDLIFNCGNKYQFAKTHSVYIKDWDKTKGIMEQRIVNGQLPPDTSPQFMRAMIFHGDKIIQEKLQKVRQAFHIKFHETIYNYLGEDGKIKKFLGIFG